MPWVVCPCCGSWSLRSRWAAVPEGARSLRVLCPSCLAASDTADVPMRRRPPEDLEDVRRDGEAGPAGLARSRAAGLTLIAHRFRPPRLGSWLCAAAGPDTSSSRDVAAGGTALVVVAAGTAAAAEQTDHTAAMLAFAAALGAAMIAAVTAGRRQRRALAAEGERQAAALAHERELRDLDDLRALLDDAALALHRIEDAAGHVREALQEHGARVGELGKDGSTSSSSPAADSTRWGRGC